MTPREPRHTPELIMLDVIDVPLMTRILRNVGIERFLRELTDYIAQDFARWEHFEKSARSASHSKYGVIELMPTNDGVTYACKYVNGHPGNPQHGMLTVTAFGVLADVASGYPLLISEMTLLTALRTAATSALAARHLARSNSRTMALIGTGAQAEFQALAFKSVNNVRRIRYFDTDAGAMRKFQRNLEGVEGLELIAARSIADCIIDADIITTATAAKARASILTPDLIRCGVHINGIGGDCPGKTEIHPAVVRSARVVVEFLPQSRVEGEIQVLGPDFDAIELWRIVKGETAGRRTSEEVTLFDSVGFAIEDFSALRYVRDLLRSHSIDARVPLLPHVADPKDLYSLIGGPERHAT